MGAAGDFLKLAGSIDQWTAEDADSRRRAKELETDQQTAQLAAADAAQRGSVLAGMARQQGTQMIAKQQVAYTAAGVDATVGTAADVAAETSSRSELDALTHQNNAAREAWGHTQTASRLGRESAAAANEPNAKGAGRVFSALGQSLNFVGDGMKMG